MDRGSLAQATNLHARLRYVWLCTRPFWVYPPAAILLLAWAGPRLGPVRSAGLLLLGLLFWTFVEWGLHWLMHVRTPARWFCDFQESAHLRHHHEPDDLARSVIMLRGSIPLALGFFGLSLAAFHALVPAALFFSGLLMGYVAYEFVHLATHARLRIPGLGRLARYHARHHGRWNRTFGVTSPLWDYVFGTLPPRDKRS